MKDIKSVEKKTNILIFDNALTLITIRGELSFASFLYRDHALERIRILLNDQLNPIISPINI